MSKQGDKVRRRQCSRLILRLVVPALLIVLVLASLPLRWVRSPAAHPIAGWRTSGADILTPVGTAYIIEGISWYGLESPQAVPYGLDSRDLAAILRAIKGYGFNTVRISFSNQMWETNPLPDPELVRACPACRHLRARDVLALIINDAGSTGLHVILDDHRSDAGTGTALNGLWYDTDGGLGYTEAVWIRDWVDIQHWLHGRRVAGRTPGTVVVHDVASDGFPTVIGYDLRNEPHTPVGAPYLQGATWGTGDGIDPQVNPNPNPFIPRCVATSSCHDWRLAAERAGDTLLGDAAAHGWLAPLIFAQGISSYPTASGTAQRGPYDQYRWGGQLEGVNGNARNPGAPIVLNQGGTAARLGPAVAHQLVYVTRDYGPTVSPTDWFTYATCYRLGCAPAHSQAGLVDLWCQHWAYINLPPGRYGNCLGGVQPHFRTAYPWKHTGGIPYTQAPVWMGEFGTGNSTSDLKSSIRGSQGQWFTDLVNFIESSYAPDARNASGLPVHDLSWNYWALDEDDSYALLGARYTSLANPAKEYSFLCFLMRAPPRIDRLPPSCGSTGALPAPR